MEISNKNRAVKALRFLLIVSLCVGAVRYGYTSIHWSLMCDSPILHYVNFLMAHGFQPYQNITDNNMPGAYLTEYWAMHVFGATDLGWRLYDFFLLLITTAAMIEIARKVDWLAGLFGGCLFILQHGSEGPVAAGEREQLITALVLIGYAFLFGAVRLRKSWLFMPVGFVFCLAATIKPTISPLGLAVVLMAAWVLRKRGIPPAPYLRWCIAGGVIPVVLVFVFLMRHHAVAPFWFVVHTITPAYVALAHPSFLDMLRNLLPRDIRWYVLIIGIPAALAPGRWDWERWALMLGAAGGLLSYFIQQKGFNHHRYLFLAILLLLIGIDVLRDLEIPGWPRVVGVIGTLLCILYFVPKYIVSINQIVPDSVFTLALENDLNRLGGQQLQGQVQCFDLIYGCLDALYHLDLVENTGFTGDLLLFFPRSGPAVGYYRQMFWEEARKDPANVLVVSNEWLQLPNTFGKLDTWPDFVVYLNRNYTLAAAREFPMEARTTPPPPRKPGDEPPRAYRIYVRNNTPLASHASALLASLSP